ncbi:MAG: EpsG family protein [Lachnospiraceae bacterium]|nr:EpsG family protein [Lachnospiraceae bacterium]
MNIYIKVIAITAVLAVIFRNNKKMFVISASLVHLFVSGFRYKYMHGDLQKYAFEFGNISGYDWNSDELLKGGRNSLFYLLNKAVAILFNGEFQALLFLVALISTVSIAVLVYKYSTKPFISFLMWNCFGFYIFSFYSIKQTLAMAFIMFAGIAILENKMWRFLVLVIIAGFIHLPAFVFLPAYIICGLRKTENIITIYIILFLSIFLARNKIVGILVDLYYESEKYTSVNMGGLGGKCLLMISLLVVGFLFCGLSDEKFRKIFILLTLASLLQIFSMYDNVFTRLADYYFQFIILFAPLMLSQVHKKNQYPALYFDVPSQKIIVLLFVMMALLFYQKTNLTERVGISDNDNLLNYHFMWDEEVSGNY